MITFLLGASIPKSVQACSTYKSYSRNDPLSTNKLILSRAVNLPYIFRRELNHTIIRKQPITLTNILTLSATITNMLAGA